MKKRQTSEDLYFTACVTERDVCSLHFEQNRHYMPSTLFLYFREQRTLYTEMIFVQRHNKCCSIIASSTKDCQYVEERRGNKACCKIV